MFRRNREVTDQFVILKGILPSNSFNRFYTSFSQGDTEESIVKLHDGTVAYQILGYAATTAEVQHALYGAASG